MWRAVLVVMVFILSVTPAEGQPVPQDGVIDMHAFTHADCSADDSAGFQAAANLWATGTKGSKLELGSGCWILNRPVRIVAPNLSAGMFGTFEGDGPFVATLHCGNGIGRCLEFDQYWFGTIQGFSVQGGGDGQRNAGNNRDVGLTLGNAAQDIGTCCGVISNVSVSGFARCWEFGGDMPPFPASAEFVLNDVGGNYCGGADGAYSSTNGGMHCGGDSNDPTGDELARTGGGTFWFGSYNTLDFVFNRIGTVGSGTTFCMGYGGPGQISIVGGGATDNQHDLNMGGDCTAVTMLTYRAEGGSNADGHPSIIAGGCPGQKLTIVGSTLRATSVYSPISIVLDNGDGSTFLVNNNLIGQVQVVQGVQTVYSYGNTILTQGGVPAFGFSDPNCCGVMRLYSAGNRQAESVPGMWPTDWWPDSIQGQWLFPPNSDAAHQQTPVPTSLPVTSTPVPPTATPQPATPTATATTLPTATPSPTRVPATSTPVPTPVVCSQDVTVSASKATPTTDAVSVDLHLEIPICR